MENINWYPGHMKKTRELIRDNLKMVDLVLEVTDARIPVSSRNPIIDELVQGKPRLIILNKEDLADPEETEGWSRRLSSEGAVAMPFDAVKGGRLKQLLKELEYEQKRISGEKGRNKPLRLMIVGVPNCGKSSLINRLTGKKSAQTGNRPGVTKGKQWLTLQNGMQLLDTPGILWPKFEDPNVGKNLAYCGSIKDEIMDTADLALELIRLLQDRYPEMLIERYKLEEVGETPLETMEDICAKRGFILPGKRIDYERCGKTVLDEFRRGIIGRITLEHCRER